MRYHEIDRHIRGEEVEEAEVRLYFSRLLEEFGEHKEKISEAFKGEVLEDAFFEMIREGGLKAAIRLFQQDLAPDLSPGVPGYMRGLRGFRLDTMTELQAPQH